jgi:hypothetical protein
MINTDRQPERYEQEDISDVRGVDFIGSTSTKYSIFSLDPDRRGQVGERRQQRTRMKERVEDN